MFGVVQEITNDRLLVRLDDAVRPLVESEDITYTAARVLGEHLHVDRCAYAFVDKDQDTFNLTGNYTNQAPSIVGRYRFRQFGEECLRLMRAGLPYVVEDSDSDPRIHFDDRPNQSNDRPKASRTPA
jgi:GAF domain-containing protein